MSNSESLSAITSFANRLQQEIKKDKRGNFVFSPLGVTLCFGMAYLGAEGITKAEMATALGYPEDEESPPFPADILKLLNTDNADSPVTLLTAQKVYYQKGEELLPEYIESLKQLDAQFGQFDPREPVRSANEINSWVRRVTKGKIENIVSQEGLSNPDLRLILINTIYFHAKWATAFEKKHTKPEDFYLNDGKTVKVKMMNRFGCEKSVEYFNSKSLQAEIVKLPYKGERFSLVVFIPKLKQGLSVLEKGMLTTSVIEYLNELKTFKKKRSQCILNVALPKFELETSLDDLRKPLRQLGIEDAFDINQADFSSISDDPDGLYISKVIQKAMIKVDESGTKAAAATAAMSQKRTSSGRKKREKRVINVVADRPFYFQLIEEKMEIVLFSGVVTDPRKKS